MTKKVVIVGAGPCGVLLAHYLLRRGSQYQVDLYERRSDPRTVAFSNARTFPISLNQRGIEALSGIQDALKAVKAMSVESPGSVFHQSNGKTRLTSRQTPLFMLDRTQLVIALLKTLSETYDHSRLNIHFDHSCTGVNFETKTATFRNTAVIPTEAETTVSYDLLVGADGARSRIREAFFDMKQFGLEQKYIPWDYKSILLPSSDETFKLGLKPGYLHSWRIDNGTTVLLVHQSDGSMSGVITFPREHHSVVDLSSAEEVLQFFQKYFPDVGQLMPPAEAEAFLTRPPSSTLTIRCSHYHYGDSVLLIGDAAHAVSPSIGQGCNSALEDVAILDQLLDEAADNLAEAIAQFTLRRKPDAHALVELSDYVFPSSNKRLIMEFFLRQRFAQLLHQLFPKRFSPSLLQLIHESTIPYSEILNLYQNWIAKVKRANERMIRVTLLQKSGQVT
jgi:kynurenine 3-monooxygenase